MSTSTHHPRRRRRIALAITAGLLLPTVGGVAWAADRYLVEHVEIADVSAYEAEQGVTSSTGGADDDSSSDSDADAADADATVTDDSYTSDDTGITVSQVSTGEGDDTVTYYVADVQVDDATQLRSAFAQDQFGTNITDETSDIADDVGAVLAVNGDYYGFRDTGIVIRNGVVYRDDGAREGLAFYTDGHAEVYDETTTTADELVADGVWNTVSFGPALVEDGSVVDGIEDVEVDTNVGNHSIQGEQPRTAIGVIDENHYVIVVVDGRQEGYSRGVTLTELAQIMTDLGATTAYNLDGGGSSTLYFDGEVVNQPSNGGERATSDILYVAG
ncbi:phosphodiester glycosidase family protein [Promicromonospora sukumoe]|uniref:Exopolysaccharide biosynthesis protein n=1 Tax=Promicromonospora sukumoe TaxID=88382 RepID=A0A7W3JA48_9MICO|nr:phosphodiester glycosidase family protein [Promicromonospora sukumoe]MBA8808984.1 exopolysaccharide biosynthesis protein [Promicromonospora sukumoe]